MNTTRRWWLLPLLVLLGLILKALILVPFARGRVEDAALAALGAEGIDSVSFAGVDGVDGIGVDGLNVVLEGPPSAEAAAVAAVQDRGEISQVVYRPVGEDPEPEPEPLPTTEDAPASDEVEVGPIDPALVTATVTGGAIVLTGVVPDEATRDDLVDAAGAEFGADNVTNELTIDPDAVTNEGGMVILEGLASSEAEQSGWQSAAGAMATAGGLELDDRSEVRSVDETLNDIFALEPIEFDTSQATIRATSIPTLDAAAEVLIANPDAGRLLVVGHTDSDGSADSNQRLSEARAQAVVDYLVNDQGVDADRLEAEGRGENELLVDPESTPEDKQMNRRIEWEKIG